MSDRVWRLPNPSLTTAFLGTTVPALFRRLHPDEDPNPSIQPEARQEGRLPYPIENGGRPQDHQAQAQAVRQVPGPLGRAARYLTFEEVHVLSELRQSRGLGIGELLERCSYPHVVVR